MSILQVAIIGLGHIGRTHIAALNQLNSFELVAACDWQTELSYILPSKVNFFETHKELLRRGGFDTVIVATPNQTHNSIAIDVLQAGYNVIVEKPAGCSLKELYILEDTARKAKRHVYYAFHAAMACEVMWLKDHLNKYRMKYGPLTGFFCRFYDPYINSDNCLVPQAASLGECWSDSGVNALSVIDSVFSVDCLVMSSRQQSGYKDKLPGIRSVSVRFNFSAIGEDSSGIGVIDTSWDQGVNFKCTELFYGVFGWRLVIDHTSQRVSVIDPSNNTETLISYEGNRLYNHYINLFNDYLICYKNNKMNYQFAQRIHHKLFEANKS